VSREVLFQPYVHVIENEDGTRHVEWDWSDTLVGEVVESETFPIESTYADEVALWLDEQIKSGALPGS
jgi:hypothetical protein